MQTFVCRTLAAAAMLLVAAALGPTWAEIPQMISYQGRVTDAGGVRVADGTYDMRFRIYDDETAGNLEWDSSTGSVQVEGGVFSVLLGHSPQPTLDLPFDEDYWLLVTFDGVAQTPRQRLASAAYAYMASGVVPGTEVTGPVNSGGALSGINTSSGLGYGLYGASASTGGAVGVYGDATATTGSGRGVFGKCASTSSSARSVYGWAAASTGGPQGVYGRSDATEEQPAEPPRPAPGRDDGGRDAQQPRGAEGCGRPDDPLQTVTRCPMPEPSRARLAQGFQTTADSVER